MAVPILRASAESDATGDDRSEDLLIELLRNTDRGEEMWFMVERLADATGQTSARVGWQRQ